MPWHADCSTLPVCEKLWERLRKLDMEKDLAARTLPPHSQATLGLRRPVGECV